MTAALCLRRAILIKRELKEAATCCQHVVSWSEHNIYHRRTVELQRACTYTLYVYIYTMASSGTDLNLNLVAKQKQGWKMTHW